MVSRGSAGEPAAAFDSLLSELFAQDGSATPASAGGHADVLLDAQAQEVVVRAVRATVEWGDRELDSTHLLWAVTQVPPTAQMLGDSGVHVDQLAAVLRMVADSEPAQVSVAPRRPPVSPAARRALLGAYRHARSEGASRVGARHVLMGLATDAESVAGRALARAVEQSERGRVPATRHTPLLDEYTLDMTEAARAGCYDPVVGRADEIEQTIEVLGRLKKNNPLLVGDPGVGKTAVMEGLAQRIAEGDVPAPLADLRLVALDVTALAGGASYRGQLEQRMHGVLEELRQAPDVVVVVDELHSLVGADSSLDAGGPLISALARAQLRVIAATTVEHHHKHVERDPALQRRFQPILVRELHAPEAVRVLRALRQRYQRHHQIRIDDEALQAAVGLSGRYLTDRFLPDKAVDVLDQACARVRLRQETGSDPAVTASDVAEVVSRRTGIPMAEITAVELQRLRDLRQRLAERVVGQDTAVRVVAEAIRRARTGLGDPDRPIGSFLFLGPTGVGKTELARGLAAALFGEADGLIRFDMGEFQEKHTISRLLGAPPGYVGYSEAGQLTERVRRQPYAVLLLDEVDKAHPDVFHMLLQVLDAGRLTDAQGRTVDFRNTVVIMTSNVGAERILGADVPPTAAELTDDLRGYFRAEFINRIDEIVVFQALGPPQLLQIAQLLLQRTAEQLRDKDVRLSVSEQALAWLVQRAWEPEFGARPLRRVIQREVATRLASLVVDGQLSAGQEVRVDAAGGCLTVHATGESAGGAVPVGTGGEGHDD